jgi:hypothetical protein
MAHRNTTYLVPLREPRGADAESTTRELDSRINDGIHVRLLWSPSDGQVSVTVNDTKTGDTFELPVPDGIQALDVFRHPYGYAV